MFCCCCLLYFSLTFLPETDTQVEGLDVGVGSGYRSLFTEIPAIFIYSISILEAAFARL